MASQKTPFQNQALIIRSGDRVSGTSNAFYLANNFYDLLSERKYTLPLVNCSFYNDVATSSVPVEIEINFMGADISMCSSSNRSTYIYTFVINTQCSYSTVQGPLAEIKINQSPPQIKVDVYKYVNNIKTTFTGISDFILVFQLKRIDE